jgi:hypothetical protein
MPERPRKKSLQGKETRAVFDETIERGKCFIGEKAEDVEAATGIRRKILRERLDARCK